MINLGGQMGTSIRIDENIYQDAKKVARLECRSTSEQIEFWAKIGKCALENPDLPIDYIQELLVSQNSDRSIAEPFSFE